MTFESQKGVSSEKVLGEIGVIYMMIFTREKVWVFLFQDAYLTVVYNLKKNGVFFFFLKYLNTLLATGLVGCVKVLGHHSLV